MPGSEIGTRAVTFIHVSNERHRLHPQSFIDNLRDLRASYGCRSF